MVAVTCQTSRSWGHEEKKLWMILLILLFVYIWYIIYVIIRTHYIYIYTCIRYRFAFIWIVYICGAILSKFLGWRFHSLSFSRAFLNQLPKAGQARCTYMGWGLDVPFCSTWFGSAMWIKTDYDSLFHLFNQCFRYCSYIPLTPKISSCRLPWNPCKKWSIKKDHDCLITMLTSADPRECCLATSSAIDIWLRVTGGRGIDAPKWLMSWQKDQKIGTKIFSNQKRRCGAFTIGSYFVSSG